MSKLVRVHESKRGCVDWPTLSVFVFFYLFIMFCCLFEFTTQFPIVICKLQYEAMKHSVFCFL